MKKKQTKTTKKRVAIVEPRTRHLAYDVDSAAQALLLPPSIVRGLIHRGLLPVSRIAGRVRIQEKSLLKVLDDAEGGEGITSEFLNSGSLDDGYVNVTAKNSARETLAGNDAVEAPALGSDPKEEQ